jgi:hypothetical protein
MRAGANAGPRRKEELASYGRPISVGRALAGSMVAVINAETA